MKGEENRQTKWSISDNRKLFSYTSNCTRTTTDESFNDGHGHVSGSNESDVALIDVDAVHFGHFDDAAGGGGRFDDDGGGGGDDKNVNTIDQG